MVSQALQFHVESEDQDVCWICLEGSSSGELLKPCKCTSRFVHRACLARWQLHSAGRDEERACRFCNEVLPDWKPALTPEDLQPTSSVMSVKYRGVTHYITYTPGPDSTKHFMAELARLGIQMSSPKNITFLCRAPDTGNELSLKGMEAFDAAAYCASISAAKRRKSQSDSTSDQGSSPAASQGQAQQQDAVSTQHSSISSSEQQQRVDGTAGVQAAGSNGSRHCRRGSSKFLDSTKTLLRKMVFWSK